MSDERTLIERLGEFMENVHPADCPAANDHVECECGAEALCREVAALEQERPKLDDLARERLAWALAVVEKYEPQMTGVIGLLRALTEGEPNDG